MDHLPTPTDLQYLLALAGEATFQTPRGEARIWLEHRSDAQPALVTPVLWMTFPGPDGLPTGSNTQRHAIGIDLFISHLAACGVPATSPCTAPSA